MITCVITALSSLSLSKKDTGLGNVLFQVSTTYGLAKDYGITPSFPQVKMLCDKLKEFGFKHGETIFRNIPDNDVPSPITYKEPANYSETYDPNIRGWLQENLSQNIILDGYLQSHLYFDRHREDLLKMFTPDLESLRHIQKSYLELFSEHCTPVSVHVRKYGNLTNVTNFYTESMNLMSSKYHNCVFYVFSNDVAWCREHLTADNVRIVHGNPDYIDMWMMSLCHHNIISHSTFAWWGAYLNQKPDKIVIYPDDALRIYYGALYSDFKDVNRATEHFYSDWTRLSGKMYV